MVSTAGSVSQENALCKSISKRLDCSCRAKVVHSYSLFGVGLICLHHPNVVIGKSIVKVCQLVFRHVARRAILRAHLAGWSRMIRVLLHGSCLNMAAQTILVVGSGIAHEFLMRIMAGYTGDAHIAIFPPAPALLQSIWLRTNVRDAHRGS